MSYCIDDLRSLLHLPYKKTIIPHMPRDLKLGFLISNVMCVCVISYSCIFYPIQYLVVTYSYP